MNTKQIRQKILSLAISGKLVAQDPNDEPASVLLERIRAEKERLIKEGKIKRDKNESKITTSDKSHYGELPESWIVCRLDEVLDYEQPTRYIVESTEYNDNFITPVLTAGKSFIIGYTDELQGIYSKLPVIIFDDFTTDSKFVDFKFKVKSSAMKILRTNHTDIKYLFYLLQTIECNNTTHKRYWISDYSHRIIPLPPLAEQRRIVAAIESAFAVIDEIERNKCDLLAAVAAAKSKILSLAISGKLVPQDPNDEPASVLLERIRAEKERLIKEGKIKRDKNESKITTSDSSHYEKLPMGWEFTTFESVCEIYMGNSINEAEKKRKYLGQQIGLPYIGTKDVSNENEIDYENGVKIPDYNEFRIAPPFSALLCVEGGSAGRKIAITNKEVCFGNKLCCFTTKLINSYFIYYYLQTAEFKEVFKSSINGIIGGVSVNKLKELLLPLPPLAEQHRIVAAVEARFEILNSIAKTLN